MRPFRNLTLALLLCAAASPALAAWPNSPFTNLQVCDVPFSQTFPQIVSDGAGGAIVAWQDLRGGANYDVYAQHVLASGAVDPSWPTGGRALCTQPSSQSLVQLVSDGAGGAIVAWQDLRGGVTLDIYAHHVLASGAADPAWPVDGRAVCTAANNQDTPQLVSDGAGGAIVTWRDARGANTDIYVQHVLASGALDPAWPVDGRALCTATGAQSEPQLVSDGAGGAIVAWQDLRGGPSPDIYAQHVLASGVADPSWATNGRALCTAANGQMLARLMPDGSGGAIVAWEDFRGGTNTDIYVQHVQASSVTSWTLDGLALCTAAGDQSTPDLVSDGAGGAIVTWYDARTGVADIYAQRVLVFGVVDPAWPTNGRVLCDAAADQMFPKPLSDGAGGAIVVWQDFRSGTQFDVYATHVLASGAVDPVWTADGNALCSMAGTQTDLQVTADGRDGIIAAWSDGRYGDFDIYAQRVGRHGQLGTPEPEIVSVEDVPNDEGGAVKVSWNASYLDLQSHPELDFYDVLRSVPPTAVELLRARGAHVHALGAARGELHPGDLLAQTTEGQTYYWEFLAAISPRHYLGGYSYIASTLGDSVAGSNPGTAFLVVGRNSAITMWWPSLPLSGYSVDDLAPAAPAPLTGHFSAGTTYLHWNRNSEADFAGYRLHRGTTAGFMPGDGNLVAALSDTGYADAAGTPHWYKLTAVDVHGNQSPVATLSPSGTVDVGAGVGARGLWFAAPQPNPAGAIATLRYALPREGRVRLTVYDAAGRLVRELANGVRPAGDHAEAWDLRDARGRASGAGLYFARLEAEGRSLSRRIAIAR